MAAEPGGAERPAAADPARDDLELARRMVRAGAEAARAAGREARPKSADPADVVTAADLAAERAVLALLPEGDAVLAEESGAAGAARRTWVVDPVDGTANFAAGRPLWCIAVALLLDGEPQVAAVLDPERDELHSARRGEATARRVTHVPDPYEATVASYIRSDKEDPALLGRLAGAVGSLRVHGSGLLELAWVADGRLDGWVQPHPSPWDWLPGRLLVEAAGGTTQVTEDGWHLAGGDALVTALAQEAPWRA